MQIIADRQALHQIPELEKELPLTMAYLEKSLQALSCRVFSPAKGALCAYFDFGADHAIAFRSDADALPVTEKSKLPYASKHPGKMHACGHDGHMAILLELARRLNTKKTLSHNVLLVFQGAEETTGGAKDICETGVLKKHGVTAIFGLHLWPQLTAGEVFSRKNEMMSRSCQVTVEIEGKPAHIASAHEAVDAMAAAVDFYTKAMALEKALPKDIFRLLKFGKFQSGTVGNVISGYTRLDGSLRAFQDEVFYSLRAGLVSIGKKVERSSGCTVSIELGDGYPAVMNPEKLYDKVRAIVPFRELKTPSMTTEDFSWYQRYVPGMFFFLGIGDTPALHANNFNFDEQILVKGADFFENLAENYR